MVEQEGKAELYLEKLNNIYDTLEYDDSLRVTFASFRLRGVAKDWWLRASETHALKDQLWTWNDFRRISKRGICLVGFENDEMTSSNN